MQQKIEEILSSPDYFRCERYRCTMRRERCQDICGRDSWLCKGCPNSKKPDVGYQMSEVRKGEFRTSGVIGRPPKVRQNDVPPGYKRCRTCNQVKTVSEFYINMRNKDCLGVDCKECVKAYNRAHWAKNERLPRKATGACRRKG